MKDVLAVKTNEGHVLAVISESGFVAPLLEKALAAHHNAVDGGEISDLKKVDIDSDGVEKWQYTLIIEEEESTTEEVYLTPCAYYS